MNEKGRHSTIGLTMARVAKKRGDDDARETAIKGDSEKLDSYTYCLRNDNKSSNIAWLGRVCVRGPPAHS